MSPLGNLLDLFLPRHCAVCGTTLLGGENCICTKCIMDMPLTWFWDLENNAMAEKFNARIQNLRDAGNRTGFEHYSYAAALFFYKGDYRRLSRMLKYDANMTTGRYVADALGRKLAASHVFEDVDVIVPVPLHWTRRLHRGYNQAEIIASEISFHLAGRVDSGILKRRRRTGSQARMTMERKAANVAGAFSADFGGRQCPSHILLVDDVFTTGSTLAECHLALRLALERAYGKKEAAAVRISAATLAFVWD